MFRLFIELNKSWKCMKQVKSFYQVMFYLSSYYGSLLHPVIYLNFRYPAARLKLSAEDLDIRSRV